MKTSSACERTLQISLGIHVYDIEIDSKTEILAKTEGKGIDIYNLERYSQEPKYPNKNASSNVAKYKKALEAMLALKASGYEAFYGWKKGDGFWISFQGHAVFLENGESGNSSFLTTQEALLLAKQFPNAKSIVRL